ncbi:response regulator with CheY-like receiver domain and winged-helix DNA-binding domain [Thioflavicoccus mobilis 8321]|uniref:Response regulator with CheY-like receiver domain and winged-helix DNA-binding domain n=1 Tax=Thioflavicoccus mobilis 8321 TaxID=765912 RepID=L0GZB4_9GAMM|nr:response regulator [Thioflavicoccus mobilis]AGA92093.1 response regulator with CheY-like receiver domain and winged-helix DNA-binding domain [Thioflavicoccus mobilis 8321]
MSDTILIVEDELRLARLLSDYLEGAGYRTTHLVDGRTVVECVRAEGPALILLDLMLPGKDGLAICREIRAFSSVPIVMTTARVEEIDRLLGLDLGADDYICKPYSPREVVARVKAVLRRAGQNGTTTSPGDPLVLDESTLRVRTGQGEVELTAVEFALLTALHATPGRIFSRDHLMDRIYRDHRVVSDRTIDSHVKKLRRKLAELLPEHDLIHSVYGVGYRYEIRPTS